MIGCCRAHDAGKIPAGERDPYVAPARRQDGGVEIAEPARGAVGQASRASPDPGDTGAWRDEGPDGDAQPNVNAGLEGLAEGRVVGDDRLDHRVAISDRARHPAAEMERNLKPHRRRVQRILVDEHDLEPKAGALDRRRASCRPGSDHEQLDALAWRQPLAVGGDRVEPSTQNIIPILPLSSGVTGHGSQRIEKRQRHLFPTQKIAWDLNAQKGNDTNSWTNIMGVAETSARHFPASVGLFAPVPWPRFGRPAI